MSKTRKSMKYVMFLLCCSIAIAGVFYFVGYRVAYDRMEASASALIPQTFYAAITDIRGNTLTVAGYGGK